MDAASTPAPGPGLPDPEPLSYGPHDVVGTLALVQPRVLAVPHQLAHLHSPAPHVLVEVTDVKLFELLQAQHACRREGRQPALSCARDLSLGFVVGKGKPLRVPTAVCAWLRGARDGHDVEMTAHARAVQGGASCR